MTRSVSAKVSARSTVTSQFLCLMNFLCPPLPHSENSGTGQVFLLERFQGKFLFIKSSKRRKQLRVRNSVSQILWPGDAESFRVNVTNGTLRLVQSRRRLGIKIYCKNATSSVWLTDEIHSTAEQTALFHYFASKNIGRGRETLRYFRTALILL